MCIRDRTTSCEVKPAGLSISSTEQTGIFPDAETTASATGLPAASFSGLLLFNFLQQLLDPHAVLDAFVEHEGKLRRPPHAKLAGQLRLEIAAAVGETLQGLFLLLVVAHNADIDFRITQIRRCINTDDRHEADARILEPARECFAQYFPYRFVDAAHPLPCHSTHHPFS